MYYTYVLYDFMTTLMLNILAHLCSIIIKFLGTYTYPYRVTMDR